jgi:chemotaxis protein MotB
MMSSGVRQLSVLDNFVTSMGRNEKGTSSNLSDVEEETEKTINTVNPEDTLNTPEETQSKDASQNESESQNTQQDTTQDTQQDTQQSTLTAEQLEQKVEETGYQQSQEMAEEIETMLENSKIQDMVSLDYNAQYVELSLSGGILFESGQAELTSEAQTLMNKVGDILVRYRKRTIEVDGHTDNVPVSNGEYKDNQFLSSARAISVYEYLLDHKNLIAANMKHSGYGDSRPKASNDTAKGRAKNRRVEIKIYNKISSDTEQN